jgi:hypothetical protein
MEEMSRNRLAVQKEVRGETSMRTSQPWGDGRTGKGKGRSIKSTSGGDTKERKCRKEMGEKGLNGSLGRRRARIREEEERVGSCMEEGERPWRTLPAEALPPFRKGFLPAQLCSKAVERTHPALGSEGPSC